MLGFRQSLKSSVHRLKCSASSTSTKVCLNGGIIGPVGMLKNGLCKRALSSSAAAEYNKDNEIIRFLTLNNLSDNPGAVKKVRYIQPDRHTLANEGHGQNLSFFVVVVICIVIYTEKACWSGNRVVQR
jgi:hypothetical protein